MTASIDSYVLDSFAILAVVFDEPATDRVSEILEHGRLGTANVAMSVVNWGEMLYIVERRTSEVDADRVAAMLDAVPVEIVPVDKPLARRAARFKAQGGMSYADCYAAALAFLRKAIVVTGDPEFRSVEGLLRVEWLPQRGASREP